MTLSGALIRQTFQLVAFSLLLIAAVALTDTGEVVLFRWVDTEGKTHYTDNFNSIPGEFKSDVVQGQFVVKGNNIRPVKPPAPEDPNTPKPKPPAYSNQLEIIEDNYFEENDYLHIRGKVKNGFPKAIRQIKVKVSFFDANDQFIRLESTYVDPIEIQPGEIGAFTLLLRAQDNINSYKTEMSWK